MQYLLMIYCAEDVDPQPGSEEFMQMISDYQAFTQEVFHGTDRIKSSQKQLKNG